jgi:glycosyltransferase involved in cell wall biosynthesis
MIVKNEEDTIGKCLDSVAELVDEIIIVDTGSTDKTKEIISQYTNLIFDFNWIDDFAAARNYSFSHAKMEYILWLDADDVLLEDDGNKFKNLIETMETSIDSVSMHYNLELDSSGNAISSLRRNRLIKRQNNFQWHGSVHEYLEVSGNILQSDIAITHCSVHHDNDRNLRIYENRLAQGEEFSPRDLYYFANELFDHQKFKQAIDFYQQFLESKKGWVEDNISACGYLADCFHELGDQESECKYILMSFKYDLPRAEFCCRLGYYQIEQNQPHQAIFWYKLATELEKPNKHWGRINHSAWSWLPHLMLSFCYAQIDNIELAYEHNETASQYLPNHPSILYNKREFEPILRQKQLSKKARKWISISKEIDQNFQLEAGTKKLRITFVMDHMNICGGVKSILEYSNYLVKRGHQVFIVCYDPEPTWMKVQANYIQVPSEMEIVESIPETDIIFTTFWNQILNCYQAQKAPVIHFEQGDTYIFEFENFDQNTQEMWRNHWSVPVPIIAVSTGLAAQIEKSFQRKPQILNYALNDEVFYPRGLDQKNSDLPRILFVGPEQWSFKGISDILSAIKIVQQSGRNIEPVWVTQIKPDSAFEGTLYIRPPQEIIGELYRTCDLYVCGSYFEAFGLPPLEAMTCGCAVISTCNVGVLEYAEHGKNCLLTNIGDPHDLAKAIIELLEDKELRAQLVQGGYETSRKYTMEIVVERIENFIYGVVRDWKSSTLEKEI